jgi:hypothetical protein
MHVKTAIHCPELFCVYLAVRARVSLVERTFITCLVLVSLILYILPVAVPHLDYTLSESQVKVLAGKDRLSGVEVDETRLCHRRQAVASSLLDFLLLLTTIKTRRVFQNTAYPSATVGITTRSIQNGPFSALSKVRNCFITLRVSARVHVGGT